MNIEGMIKLASVLLSAAGFLVALGFWRRAVIDMTKLSLFSARSDLFYAAARASALDDPAYREARLAINGILRQVHYLNGPKWLFIATLYLRHKNDHDFIDPSTSPISAEIVAARRTVARVIKRHMWLAGVGSALVMLLLFMTGKISKCIQAVIADSERVGRDDDYARDRLSGGGWGGPGIPCPN